MEWKQLLSPHRVGSSKPGVITQDRSPFQRDFDRIVFSGAFRRLQDKTQVFPLVKTDYVRTRLTHSLETSSVGRSLGTAVGVEICKNFDTAGAQPSDIGAAVAAAALAHDIGNPPLGHAGEEAIRYWFTHSPVACAMRDVMNEDEAADIAYDFGSPVEGYEAPYAKAQMQMWVDGAKIANPPKNPDEFLAFCQEHAGQVTYPQPGDFTGTAFISCLIAGVIGKEEFEKLSTMSEPTEDEVRAIIEPGLEYLRSLNPYLWNQGTTFPADSTTVSTMYADGELVMNMGYGAPQADVDDGILPATTTSFLFDTGTVGNTNYMAIAANAPHKAAALVAINEVMSPEMQLDQYQTLGNITVLDMSKLPAETQEEFDSVELGSTQLPVSELLAVRVAEAAGPVIPIIEQLWLDEVVGK